MNENLSQLLKSFPAFSKEDVQRGLNCIKVRSFKKDEYLIRAGKTCDWIAFVSSGIVRNYYYTGKGEEVTYCVTFPNTFITAYSSFINDSPTFEYLHAITDVEAAFLYKKDYQRLVESSKAWFEFSKYFAEQSYVLMEKRLLALQMESAEQRYQNLVKDHPEYMEHVPLKYLASYLGITSRHLSRLRKDTTA